MAQFNISITVPDAHQARFINAVSKRLGYSSMLADGTTPNPQTRRQFIDERVREYLKSLAVVQLVQDDAEAAAATRKAEAEGAIVVT